MVIQQLVVILVFSNGEGELTPFCYWDQGALLLQETNESERQGVEAKEYDFLLGKSVDQEDGKLMP